MLALLAGAVLLALAAARKPPSLRALNVARDAAHRTHLLNGVERLRQACSLQNMGESTECSSLYQSALDIFGGGGEGWASSSSRAAVNATARDRNAAAYERWTRTALKQCGGHRIAIYGSTFARALLWSTMYLFTGARPAAAVDTHIPMYDAKRILCMADAAFDGLATSCKSPRFLGAHHVCHYPVDVGVDHKNCGWPFAKLWRYALDTGVATSPPALPLPGIGELATRLGALSSNVFEVVYGFRSWPGTPIGDSVAMRHFEALAPDILVLESHVWGFSAANAKMTAGAGAAASASAPGRVGHDEDVAWACKAAQQLRSPRACEKEQARRFDALLAKVERHVPSTTAVVHLVESRGAKGHAQRSAQVRAAVDRLAPQRRRRHLFLDHTADATDAWARALTLLACNEMRTVASLIGQMDNVTNIEVL